jgi:hypothetical protein
MEFQVRLSVLSTLSKKGTRTSKRLDISNLLCLPLGLVSKRLKMEWKARISKVVTEKKAF